MSCRIVGAHQHQRRKRLRRKLLHWTQLRRYRAVKDPAEGSK